MLMLIIGKRLKERQQIEIIQKQIGRMFKKRGAKQQQILNLNDHHQHKENSQSKNSQTTNSKQIKDLNIDRQQPQKKVKLDLSSNLISSSTTEHKQKKQAELHKEFKSLSYQAGQQLSTDDKNNYSKSQLLLEEELAKQKYMENVNTTKDIKEGKLDTTVYRGINQYANYALTQDEIVNAEEKFRKIQGPSRVSSAIRNTCRFDYNFGLCKDWHDSGYCPFGDSCLYLHDRSNYKTGWEQERDFERAEKERWRRISNPDIAAKEDMEQALKSIEKNLPITICEKCNKQFKSPVEVDCGHIFCSSCAVTMSKCVMCKKTLSGIMNNAEKKMQKMKQTYEQLKAKVLQEHQQSKVKRKRFTNVDSQNVFAD